MEAMPTVSSSVEKLPQIPHISLTQRHQTIRHPEKCSKPENDAICGLVDGPAARKWLEKECPSLVAARDQPAKAREERGGERGLSCAFSLSMPLIAGTPPRVAASFLGPQ